MKIRVGILEQDNIYMTRLVRYFATYYIDKVEMSVFHNEDMLLDFLQYSKIDVLLANPELIPENAEFPRTMMIAYLSESSGGQLVDNVKVISKYQRAGLLYQEILGLYAELDRKTSYQKAEGASPVYLFMGASGGVGTTTVAIACAVSLASYGKRVLYLNLEENGVIAPFLEGDGNATLSDVLYAVKSKRSNLLLKMESMVRKSEQGVYFYEPFTIALDAHEMSEDDLKEIIDTVTLYDSYDCIVVDIDSEVQWKRDLLMGYAKTVFLISDGSEISDRKLERTLNEFMIKDKREDERNIAKTKVLYNRYLKKSKKADSVCQENIYGMINAVEKSSPKNIVEEISRKPVFDKLV